VLGADEKAGHARRLEQILRDHQEFRRHVVPLCAAETPLSDFVRSFISDSIHEKYAMGGPRELPGENFIGAEFVLDLHRLTIDLCSEIYGVPYADPRPLSGTGAVTNLLMALSGPGQRILLQTPDSGGHASMTPICRRLGLEIIDLPYNYPRFQIDSNAGRRAAREGVDFVLLAPSDILYPPDFDALEFPEETTVIYDATQTLGLIASGHLPSPFESHPRLVVSGGTHKTLPGPSCGLLLTKNEEIASKIDSVISPKYVRHSHPHHMAALCATLIEQQAVGWAYSDRIRQHTNTLSACLTELGLAVLQDGDRNSETHQVFLRIEASELDAVYGRALRAGITLNAKRKPLFQDSGLRLGVQELARYQWNRNDIERLGTVLRNVIDQRTPIQGVRRQVRELAELNTFAPEMCLPARVSEENQA
jgi:glycine hydroxymethyltransferase